MGQEKAEEVVMNNGLSKALFDEQVKNLGNTRLLQLRLWDVAKIEYPTIDVIFRQPSRTPFRVRFICESWPELPPSIELLFENGDYLQRLPQGTSVLNSGPHPLTGRPFICTPGSREYHTHSGHITDLWDYYKEQQENDLGGILTQIWNAWKKTID